MKFTILLDPFLANIIISLTRDSELDVSDQTNNYASIIKIMTGNY